MSYSVGDPVIEHGTGYPRIVKAINTTLTGRPSYDLVDGSNGLNENEIDAIIGWKIEMAPLRHCAETGVAFQAAVGFHRCLLISDDDEEIGCPSDEYLMLVVNYLQRKLTVSAEP